MQEPKSPKSAEEQDAPQQERMTTPQEEAGMDIAEMEDPPQAEGDRDAEDGSDSGSASGAK